MHPHAAHSTAHTKLNCPLSTQSCPAQLHTPCTRDRHSRCALNTQAAAKVEVTFNCPFCNSSKTVSCNMDWEMERGTVECSACHMNHTIAINHLTEPVDVYSEWLDACEEANA